MATEKRVAEPTRGESLLEGHAEGECGIARTER